MNSDSRFAALKGPQREWVDLEDFDWDSDEDSLLYESPPDGEWSYELEHDGWSEIVPRDGSLARIADKFDLTQLSSRS